MLTRAVCTKPAQIQILPALKHPSQRQSAVLERYFITKLIQRITARVLTIQLALHKIAVGITLAEICFINMEVFALLTKLAKVSDISARRTAIWQNVAQMLGRVAIQELLVQMTMSQLAQDFLATMICIMQPLPLPA